MFTIFHIAPVERARDLLNEDASSDIETLTVDGIGDWELMQLGELLLQREYQPTLALEDQAEGLFVVCVDPGLIERLASADDPTLDAVVSFWSGLPELADWPREELEASVKDLASFARRARAQQQNVLTISAV